MFDPPFLVPLAIETFSSVLHLLGMVMLHFSNWEITRGYIPLYPYIIPISIGNNTQSHKIPKKRSHWISLNPMNSRYIRDVYRPLFFMLKSVKFLWAGQVVGRREIEAAEVCHIGWLAGFVGFNGVLWDFVAYYC